MSSLRALALVVNMLFSGLCPGCGGKLADHRHSRRYPPEPAVGIVVLLGLCYPQGLDQAPGLQKISWVQMSEPLTEAEYRKRYGDRPPPMERCPCCRGELNHHGRYPRWVGNGDFVERLFIYRGLCKNPECPVVTVTHYPVFVIPYTQVSAEVVEEVVRERVEKGLTWEKMSEKWGFDVKTMLRWYSSVRNRAKDIINVLLFHEEKYRPAAAAGVPPVSSGTILTDLFGVADRVAELLTPVGLWRQEIPRLSLARVARHAGVSPVPVWVW